MSRRGLDRRQQQTERFARYCELRDQGSLWPEAITDVGLAISSGYRYERAYRQLRGLPPGKPVLIAAEFEPGEPRAWP